MGEYRALYSNGNWDVFIAGSYKHAKKTAEKKKPGGFSVVKVQKVFLEEGRDLRGYEATFEITGRKVHALGTRYGKKDISYIKCPIFARNGRKAREIARKEVKRLNSRLATRITNDGVVGGSATLESVVRKGKATRQIVETRGGPEKQYEL